MSYRSLCRLLKQNKWTLPTAACTSSHINHQLNYNPFTIQNSNTRRFLSKLTPLKDEEPPRESWFGHHVTKMRLRLGLLEQHNYYYRKRAVILYESLDEIDTQEFFKRFSLEDTFFSWFLIRELHMWMLLTRSSAEGREGLFLNKCMVEMLWEDTKKRAKKLQPGSVSTISDNLMDLHEQMTAAVILYDEGLQSPDMVLAGVLWRRVLQEKCNEPEAVELLVKYTRSQIQHLDSFSRDQFLRRAEVTWLPLPQKV